MSRIDPEKNEDLVIAPGGTRPRDRVRLIAPGTTLKFEEGKPGPIPVTEPTERPQARVTNMSEHLDEFHHHALGCTLAADRRIFEPVLSLFPLVEWDGGLQ
jgi:hypothetical protein